MGAKHGRLSDRVWRHIRTGAPGECWTWTAHTNAGYGVLRGEPRDDKPTTVQAHRVVYELLVGPIPDGHVLDHECHNRDITCAGGDACPHRACSNPDHLVTVPRSGNSYTGAGPVALQVRQARCKRGHDLNDRTVARVDRRGRRRCRPCAALHEQDRRARM